MLQNTTAMAGAALALVLLADQAAADCRGELNQLEARFREAVLPVAAHRDVRTLLRAGKVLARDEASAPCDALAAEIDRMLAAQEGVVADAPAVMPLVPVALSAGVPLVDAEALKEVSVFGRNGERLGAISAVAVALDDSSGGYALVTPARTGVGLTPIPFDALTPALDPETLRARVAAHQAQVGNDPLLRMRASELIDRDVMNAVGEEISEVEDVVVMEGEAGPFLLIEVGGFLGIGEKQIAVALSEFELIDGQLVLAANVTEEDMEAAPDFDPKAGQPIDRSQVLLDVKSLESDDEQRAGREVDLDEMVMAIDLSEDEFAEAPAVDRDSEAAWQLTPEQRQALEEFYAPR